MFPLTKTKFPLKNSIPVFFKLNGLYFFKNLVILNGNHFLNSKYEFAKRQNKEEMGSIIEGALVYYMQSVEMPENAFSVMLSDFFNAINFSVL